MNATDSSGDIIDMKRSGSGNTDYRVRAFLHQGGRVNTVVVETGKERVEVLVTLGKFVQILLVSFHGN